jgi:hypothetical protein
MSGIQVDSGSIAIRLIIGLVNSFTNVVPRNIVRIIRALKYQNLARSCKEAMLSICAVL